MLLTHWLYFFSALLGSRTALRLDMYVSHASHAVALVAAHVTADARTIKGRVSGCLLTETKQHKNDKLPFLLARMALMHAGAMRPWSDTMCQTNEVKHVSSRQSKSIASNPQVGRCV